MSRNLKQTTSKIAFASLLAISSNSVLAQDTLSFPISTDRNIIEEFFKTNKEIDFVQLNGKGAFSIEKNDFTLNLKSSQKKLSVQVNHNDKSDIEFVMVTGNVYSFFIKQNNRLTEIHLSADFTISIGPQTCTNMPQVLLNWKYISTDGKEHFSHGHCSHYSSNPK